MSLRLHQLLDDYYLPAQRGDTSWMSQSTTMQPSEVTTMQPPSQLITRTVEEIMMSGFNYLFNAGTHEDFPVVENVLRFEPADRASVENLEIKKAADELAAHDEVCSICLEGWEKGDDVKILPCGHYFHPACADEWLFTNRFCPLCRFELLPTSIPLLQE
ncbi:hypothetical protein SOVF_179290 [Spinacia oleracea]|nr:hypothetical protein SOVF_179290 [Spinacia oleracea]